MYYHYILFKYFSLNGVRGITSILVFCFYEAVHPTDDDFIFFDFFRFLTFFSNISKNPEITQINLFTKMMAECKHIIGPHVDANGLIFRHNLTSVSFMCLKSNGRRRWVFFV